MSAAAHDTAARSEERMATVRARLYDPTATSEHRFCRGRGTGRYGDICWTSSTNPTASHQRAADEHRRRAADHRAASAALVEAETHACVGVVPDDRDLSPFMHTDDIARVSPLRTKGGEIGGAVVVFKPIEGLTPESLRRVINCHLARNAALGHDPAAMPNCPLVLRGVEAAVVASPEGLAVEIRDSDPATANEIYQRTNLLIGAGAAPTTEK